MKRVKKMSQEKSKSGVALLMVLLTMLNSASAMADGWIGTASRFRKAQDQKRFDDQVKSWGKDTQTFSAAILSDAEEAGVNTKEALGLLPEEYWKSTLDSGCSKAGGHQLEVVRCLEKRTSKMEGELKKAVSAIEQGVSPEHASFPLLDQGVLSVVRKACNLAEKPKSAMTDAEQLCVGDALEAVRVRFSNSANALRKAENKLDEAARISGACEKVTAGSAECKPEKAREYFKGGMLEGRNLSAAVNLVDVASRAVGGGESGKVAAKGEKGSEPLSISAEKGQGGTGAQAQSKDKGQKGGKGQIDECPTGGCNGEKNPRFVRVDRCHKDLAAAQARATDKSGTDCLTPAEVTKAQKDLTQLAKKIKTSQDGFDVATQRKLDVAQELLRSRAMHAVQALAESNLGSCGYSKALDRLAKACSEPRVDGKPVVGFAAPLNTVLTGARSKYLSEGDACFSGGKPNATLEEQHDQRRDGAYQAAMELAQLGKQLKVLAQDFAENEDEFFRGMGGFLPCQNVLRNVVGAVNAGKAVCKGMGRVSADGTRFEASGKVSDMGAVALASKRGQNTWTTADELLEKGLSVNDDSVVSLQERGMKGKSLFARCEIKSRAATRVISRMAQLKMAYPELDIRTDDSGKRDEANGRPLYEHLGKQLENSVGTDNPTVSRILNEGTRSYWGDGVVQSWEKEVAALCEKPVEMAEGLLTQGDQLFHQVYACSADMHATDPSFAGVEMERVAACRARRDQEGDPCKEVEALRPSALSKVFSKEGLGVGMQVFDELACVAVVGGAASGLGKSGVAGYTNYAAKTAAGMGRGAAALRGAATSAGVLAKGAAYGTVGSIRATFTNPVGLGMMGVFTGIGVSQTLDAKQKADSAPVLVREGLMTPEEAAEFRKETDGAIKRLARDMMLGVIFGGVSDHLSEGVTRALVGKVKSIQLNRTPEMIQAYNRLKDTSLTPLERSTTVLRLREALLTEMAKAYGPHSSEARMALLGLNEESIKRIFEAGRFGVLNNPAELAALIRSETTHLHDVREMLGYLEPPRRGAVKDRGAPPHGLVDHYQHLQHLASDTRVSSEVRQLARRQIGRMDRSSIEILRSIDPNQKPMGTVKGRLAQADEGLHKSFVEPSLSPEARQQLITEVKGSHKDLYDHLVRMSPDEATEAAQIIKFLDEQAKKQGLTGKKVNEYIWDYVHKELATCKI